MRRTCALLCLELLLLALLMSREGEALEAVRAGEVKEAVCSSSKDPSSALVSNGVSCGASHPAQNDKEVSVTANICKM